MTKAVLYEIDPVGIVTLTLNRPDLRNPVSDPEMVAALVAALARLDSDLACMCDLRIAANPPHAVRMTNRLLWEGRRADLATLLEMASAMQAAAHATCEHVEAVNAFLEKRTPQFKGT